MRVFCVAVFCIFLCVIVLGVNIAEKADPLRLVEYNETSRVWMRQSKVAKLEAECGAGRGFMDITDFQNITLYRGARFTAFPSGPTHQTIVNPLLSKINSARISGHISELAAFSTRYYTSSTGEAAALKLRDKYAAHANSRVSVDLFKHSWKQPSIIARITGSKYPDEVVIVGGHIDSISGFGKAPGADDDGTGSASVLETFLVLVENGFIPERSIEFHGYSAEEVGLLGSQAIADFYSRQNVNVVGMLQLDMTGYVGSAKPQIALVTDYVSASLNTFLRTLIDTYCVAPWINDKCGYACSDHASWNKVGYPAAHPFEDLSSRMNPNIHTSSDTMTHITMSHVVDFVRLSVSYAVELSFKN